MITFSGQAQRVYSVWSEFSLACSTRFASLQWEEWADRYFLWFYDLPEVHTFTIWTGSVPQDVIDAGLTQEANDEAKTDFETNFKDVSNQPIISKVSGGFPVTKVHTVEDEDGKQVVVQYPATDGFKTFFSSCGDGTERGNGTAVNLTFTGPGTQTVDLVFNDCIEIHDGEVHWFPPSFASYIKDVEPIWAMVDTFSVGLILPATEATANAGGTGNANKVAIGGGANLIVPSYGGPGAWDVDLENAVPIPAEAINTQTGTLEFSGYWDCNYFTGNMSAGSPGTAPFHLLDVPQSGWLIRNITMDDPMGQFEIDVYKTEWCHRNWKLRLECVKVSGGAGTIGGWLMMFRRPG